MAGELKPPSMGTSKLSLVPCAALAAHRCWAAAHCRCLALSVTLIAAAEGGHSNIYMSLVLFLSFSLR